MSGATFNNISLPCPVLTSILFMKAINYTMLAVIVTVVVHCMERTFVCCSTMLGTGEVARGHTNRAAQCVPMGRIGCPLD